MLSLRKKNGRNNKDGGKQEMFHKNSEFEKHIVSIKNVADFRLRHKIGMIVLQFNVLQCCGSKFNVLLFDGCLVQRFKHKCAR